MSKGKWAQYTLEFKDRSGSSSTGSPIRKSEPHDGLGYGMR